MTVSCCVFINQSIIGEVRRKVAPSSPGAVTPGPYLFMGPVAVAETKTARVSKRLGLHIDGVLYKKEKKLYLSCYTASTDNRRRQTTSTSALSKFKGRERNSTVRERNRLGSWNVDDCLFLI